MRAGPYHIVRVVSLLLAVSLQTTVLAEQIIYFRGGVTIGSAQRQARAGWQCAEAPESSPVSLPYLLNHSSMQLKVNGLDVPIDERILEYIEVVPEADGQATVSIVNEAQLRAEYGVGDGTYEIRLGPSAGIAKKEATVPGRLAAYQRIEAELLTIDPQLRSIQDRADALVRMAKPAYRAYFESLRQGMLQFYVWARLPAPAVENVRQLRSWHANAEERQLAYQKFIAILAEESRSSRFDQPTRATLDAFSKELAQLNWDNAIDVNASLQHSVQRSPLQDMDIDLNALRIFKDWHVKFQADKQQFRSVFDGTQAKDGRIKLVPKKLKHYSDRLITGVQDQRLPVSVSTLSDYNSGKFDKLFAKINQWKYVDHVREELFSQLEEHSFNGLHILMDLPIPGDATQAFDDNVKKQNTETLRRFEIKYNSIPNVSFEHIRAQGDRSIRQCLVESMWTNPEKLKVVIVHSEYVRGRRSGFHFADDSRTRTLNSYQTSNSIRNGFLIVTCGPRVKIAPEDIERMLDELTSDALANRLTLRSPVERIFLNGQLRNNLAQSLQVQSRVAAQTASAGGGGGGDNPPNNGGNGAGGSNGGGPSGGAPLVQLVYFDSVSRQQLVLSLDEDGDDDDDKKNEAIQAPSRSR